MNPEPEPRATAPTAVENANANPAIDTFAQRAVRGDVNWRIWERALVMLWSIALICGLLWTAGILSSPFSPARAATPNVSASMQALAGRWQGQPMGFLDPEKVCGSKGCTLTLDLVSCGEGAWCGIRVEDQSSCGAVALNLKSDPAPDPRVVRPVILKGELQLADGTQPYTVEAELRSLGDKGGFKLAMTGDTGGAAMKMMRRSFPFATVMTRLSDPVCKYEKPAV